MWIDYLFTICDEESDLCGEEFLVEVKATPDAKKVAWEIAKENFPGECMTCCGPFSTEEAEIMGLDTY